jgi:hypothetical protein
VSHFVSESSNLPVADCEALVVVAVTHFLLFKVVEDGLDVDLLDDIEALRHRLDVVYIHHLWSDLKLTKSYLLIY